MAAEAAMAAAAIVDDHNALRTLLTGEVATINARIDDIAGDLQKNATWVQRGSCKNG